jgi:hypothetical protein
MPAPIADADTANLRRGLRNGLILAVLFFWAPLIAIVVGIINLVNLIAS